MIKPLAKLSTIVLNQVNNVTDLYSKLYKTYPRQCLLCHSKIYGRNICHYCYQSLPRLTQQCKLCSWPIQGDMTKCNFCVEYLGNLSIQIAFPYVPPIDKLIHQFKYNNDLVIGRLLADLLLDYIKIPKADAIIPVPIHKTKLNTRGFNQSLELARYLSKHIGIKLDNNLIAKYRATKSQMGQDKFDRKSNIKNSFCLNYKPKYKSVILVDDVVTTGSTMLELINLLYSANVRKITLWAVARRL